MKTHRLLSLAALAIGAMAFSNAASAQSPVTAAVSSAAQPLGTVQFNCGSDRITPAEYENVVEMAEWMQADPSRKLHVTGYSDRGTGGHEFNHAMSERRATAVAEELEYTFGIDPSRITVDFFGDEVQPFANNADNRVVIFTKN